MALPRRLRFKIREFLRLFGYDLYKIFPTTGGLLYEPIHSKAFYSPWNTDQAFLDAYSHIRDITYVDIYRSYELWSLVEQSAKLRGALIEVGVWRGGTATLIAKQAARCGIPSPVYLCDTFRGVVKGSAKDSAYKGGEHADTSREAVEELVRRQGLTNVRILEGVFPEETAHLVTEDEIRFAHIDVDVYESAKDIMTWIWDRMVIGGVIVYDDYGFLGTDGITKFVDEQKAEPDRLIVYNLNGHAVVIKIA